MVLQHKKSLSNSRGFGTDGKNTVKTKISVSVRGRHGDKRSRVTWVRRDAITGNLSPTPPFLLVLVTVTIDNWLLIFIVKIKPSGYTFRLACYRGLYFG
jgi:hypothetical protein